MLTRLASLGERCVRWMSAWDGCQRDDLNIWLVEMTSCCWNWQNKLSHRCKPYSTLKFGVRKRQRIKGKNDRLQALLLWITCERRNLPTFLQSGENRFWRHSTKSRGVDQGESMWVSNHSIKSHWEVGWKNEGQPRFFLNNFDVFGYLMKHFFECLI